MKELKEENIITIPQSISLSVASPEKVMAWSRGEVTKPETINYRTGRSERNGLFDERIFGPEKDYECYCGKYRRIRYKGVVCEKCQVEVTRSIVRRERMGHITLATPVAHIWFLRGVPSRMSLLLGISISRLEKVIYFAGYIITNVDEEERERIIKTVDLEYKNKYKTLVSSDDKEKLKEVFIRTKNEVNEIQKYVILNEIQYSRYARRYGTMFEAGIGAEAIYKIFKDIDLVQLEEEVRHDLEKSRATNRSKIEKRLKLVRSLISSETRPEWMFLKVIPVTPPALRPMVPLEGGRHATSDVNDLYRRVINRNNRLKKLIKIGAPDVILRNEKRILQEAVDSLIDNSIRKSSGSAAVSASQRRSLKSLADHLKGKQGIFRQNLLGKRVDYSGRSVIVVGPNLKINQCGLPKNMALELFRPFVIGEILKRELAFNIRGAGRLIDEGAPEIWEILENVIEGKYVLLNRAPTLHRLSIQAFNPILIEGKAIQIHPLVCSAFNADFDGDQMAVHLPLSKEAQVEARELMAANKNLLNPQHGGPITRPDQDIVLGCYWMTKSVEGKMGEGKIFSRPNEAIMAYDYGQVDFRAKIKVIATDKEKYVEFAGQPFETTIGRLLFNSIMPSDYPFINREMKKKDLARIVKELVTKYGIDVAPKILDKIKDFGYKYVTLSGTTMGYTDFTVPSEKDELLEKGEKQVEEITSEFNDGFISDKERHQKTVEIWDMIKGELSDILKENLKATSESVYDMITSGARGNMGQLNQSSGMKGIIVNAVNEQLDFPIKSNFKEGFSPLEYFINTTTARKGLTDTALKTAQAGYLTRRLHDVAQDVVITDDDCGTKRGITIKDQDFDGLLIPLTQQVEGRVLAETLKNTDGDVLFKRNHLVGPDDIAIIADNKIEEALVRSPLTCQTLHGLCRNCYGLDLGRNHLVKLGEAVGTIASQAIGEPGTQLTLRTFHLGGVSGADITSGLPRVEELLEKRSPKIPAVISPVDGEIMSVKKSGEGYEIEILADVETVAKGKSNRVILSVDPRRYVKPETKKGVRVVKGQVLTDGSVDLMELFGVAHHSTVQKYIIDEITKVYELQGAPVSPKHFEVIVRQMFSRRRIKSSGDTIFTAGEIVEYITLVQENDKVKLEGGTPAVSEKLIMGISEVSLSTASWLAAASFQHTTRVLITNAVRARKDDMRGLKENVIIGNLIPAGTGYSKDFVEFDFEDTATIMDESEEVEDLEENRVNIDTTIE